MTRDESRRHYAARYRRVVAAAKSAVPYPDIAERFGVTRSRISQICTRAGVYRKRRPSRKIQSPQEGSTQ